MSQLLPSPALVERENLVGVGFDPLKVELEGRLSIAERADGKKRKGPKLLPDIIRFLAKVDNREDIPGECWLWEGQHNWAGYSLFQIKRHGGRWHSQVAHKWLYEDQRGPVPAGLDLDHRCRNRGCVNPDHLEPVTRRINLLRGETTTALNAAKTHCPHGHPYNAENTLYTKRGTRYCRECNRLACLAYSERRSVK